jgi:hypothetical protein
MLKFAVSCLRHQLSTINPSTVARAPSDIEVRAASGKRASQDFRSLDGTAFFFIQLGNSEVSSDCEQANIHLIKLEGVFFPAAIGGYCSVAIQNIVDELRPVGFGQTARPFDTAYRTESGKSRT